MKTLVWRSSVAGGAIILALLAFQARQTIYSASVAQQSETVQFIAADVDYAASERDLVAKAQLIVVGKPTDAGQAVAKNEDPFFADYYQTIAVEQVLKGGDPGPTVRIVRAGTVQADQSKIVKHEEEAAGALAQERQVLFLGPSGDAGVYSIVGHTSGAMPLTASGQVARTRPELKGFEGLDIGAIRGKLQALEAGK